MLKWILLGLAALIAIYLLWRYRNEVETFATGSPPGAPPAAPPIDVPIVVPGPSSVARSGRGHF